MSNPFSSALSYLGYGGSDKGISEAASRFVGQIVDLGGESKLKVRKVIAEGEFLFNCSLLYYINCKNFTMPVRTKYLHWPIEGPKSGLL